MLGDALRDPSAMAAARPAAATASIRGVRAGRSSRPGRSPAGLGRRALRRARYAWSRASGGNCQIRRHGQVVQNCPRVAVFWPDIPGLSSRVHS